MTTLSFALVALLGLGTSPPPLSPEESLAAMVPRPGFVVELMAAEPLVMDPIAFDWDTRGRLWVVEMADYPLGLDDKGKPGGRIKILEDTQGKGRFDKATLFLDGIPFPTDILCWGDGVLITAAPEVFLAEDTDGDGKADRKRVLFTGFKEANQQHRVNGLRWGLDNWIYLANGDGGGSVRSIATGKQVNLSGHDLRLSADLRDLDLTSGTTQYGRCRDDSGEWFGCNNSNPLWHFIGDDRYLRRNPHVPPPAVRNLLIPNQAIFPISEVISHFRGYKKPTSRQGHRFTSACSPAIYRDTLFGPDFADSVFVSEPVHNLIHRQILKRSGTTFTAHRANDETDCEFLASKDSWFRPCTIRVGPDGALWIADMYRIVIEHPQWIDTETVKNLELRAGHDKGRIYRVYPKNARPRAFPKFIDSNGRLAEGVLDSSSGWVRDRAQQLIAQKQVRREPERWRKMAETHPDALGRLHALWALDALDPAAVPVELLTDPRPEIRRAVVRRLENLLGDPQAPDRTVAALAKLVDDPDSTVRLQLACSLGESRSPIAAKALAELARRHAGDPALRAAAASSLRAENLSPMVAVALAEPAVFEMVVRTAVGLGDDGALARLVAALTPSGGEASAAQRLTKTALVRDLLKAKRGSDRGTLLRDVFAAAEAAARKLVDDPSAEVKDRIAAVAHLGQDAALAEADHKRFAELLGARAAPEMQSAAVAAIGKLDPTVGPAMLLAHWPNYAPRLRGEVLDALLLRDEGIEALVSALEKKKVEPSQIGATRRQRLIASKDASLRRRSASVFGGVQGARGDVLEKYLPALKLAGDATRGRAIFAKSCSACHALDGVGKQVGGDLAGIKDKSDQALLTAILDPNQAVEDRFRAYMVTTRQGLVHVGLVTSESAAAVTLASADGKQTVVLRADIDEFRDTGRSFMPEGLESEIDLQAFADLLAFIRNAR